MSRDERVALYAEHMPRAAAERIVDLEARCDAFARRVDAVERRVADLTREDNPR